MTNELEVMHEYSRKLYFDLTEQEKEVINELFISKSHSFVVNPSLHRQLEIYANKYVVFIDARRNDLYRIVKTHLVSKYSNISSFTTIGDVDFIVEYYSTKKFHERFIREMNKLLKKAPDISNAVVMHYSITKTYIEERIEVPESKKIDTEIA